MKALFASETWIAWMAATLSGGIMLSSYIYSTFQTKAEAKEVKEQVERRIERMDNKLDRILELMQGKK